MSELRDKQVKFARDLSRLIAHAFDLGYEVTLSEVKRDQRIADLNATAGKGISRSLHLVSLAVDLNLFKHQEYLDKSEDHEILGEWWKSLGPEHFWGGDFKDSKGNPKPDGNHYSIGYEGRK